MPENILYYGDNLDVLRRKVRDDSIDLCYIAPPFNSKRNYFQIYNNIGKDDDAQNIGKDDDAQAQAFIDTWTWNELALAGYQEILTNFEGRYTKQTIELLKGLKAVLGEGGLLAYLIIVYPMDIQTYFTQGPLGDRHTVVYPMDIQTYFTQGPLGDRHTES